MKMHVPCQTFHILNSIILVFFRCTLPCATLQVDQIARGFRSGSVWVIPKHGSSSEAGPFFLDLFFGSSSCWKVKLFLRLNCVPEIDWYLSENIAVNEANNTQVCLLSGKTRLLTHVNMI